MRMILHLKQMIRTVLFLAFVGIGFSTNAQGTNINLSMTRDSEGNPGDIIRLPVKLNTNVDAENIIAFKLGLYTNPELKPVGISQTGSLTESWQLIFTETSPSYFSVTGAGAQKITGTGDLFYIDFELQPVNTQMSPGIYLNTSANNYFNEGGYTFTFEYGQIKIIPIPKLSVTINGSPLTKGKPAPIYVSGGTEPYTYTVSTPSIASVVNGNSLQGNQPGTVTVEVEDANGVKGTSNAVEIRGYELSFAGPATSVADSEIEITVTTTDLNGLNILSGSFDVTWSGGATLLETVQTGTLLEGASLEVNTLTAQSRRIVFAKTGNVASGTSLVKLRMKIDNSTSNGSLYFSASNILFNENLPGNQVAVSFPFTGLPKPVISGNATNLAMGETIQFNVSGGTGPYTWTVSNPDLASISTTGLLTVLKGGSVKVKVTDSFGQYTETEAFTLFDGVIRMPDYVTPGNKLYDYPVYISALPTDRKFSAFSLNIQLTPAQAEFVEIVKTNTLSETFQITVNSSDPQNIRVAAASSTPVGGNGVLFYVRVNLKPEFLFNQITYVSMTNVLFNEGTPSARIKNGSIKIGDTPPVSSNVVASIDEDMSYQFTPEVFNYSQVDGKPFTRIIIDQLPVNGSFFYNNSPINYLTTIEVSNFNIFKYVPTLNQNGTPSDSFKFRVNDGTNYSNDGYTFTFNVTPVNDVPAFVLSSPTVTVDQDFVDPVSVTVTEQSPANEASQNITYSISPTSVDFANISIDAAMGVISVTSKPGVFGTQVFTVTADDGQSVNNVFEQSFTLTVNRFNTLPVFGNANFSIAENSPASTLVGTVSGIDGEGDELTYSIDAGNTNSAFSIDAATGAITIANPAAVDFEITPTFTLTVSAFDGFGETSATVTISVTDVDEANSPTVADQSFSIAENSANDQTVGTVVATDPNGDALAFAIVSGNTNSAFTINSTTGEVRVANSAALDFETTPSFTLGVSVSDGVLTAYGNVTITVTDVFENSAPVIGAQLFTIAENSLINSSVGVVAASDANLDPLTFAITAGNTNNAFEINPVSGEITISNPVAVNFEVNPSFSLTVMVTDGNAESTATITVNLTDVDETNAPVIADQSFEIEEGSNVNTVIGTVVATDPNSDAITFAIVSGNTNAAFAIGTSSGQIVVNNPNELDFESTTTYTLVVSASDATRTSFATVTINILDVDDAFSPVIFDQIFSVNENSDPGLVIGSVEASDPNGDALTFSILSGNVNNAVALTSTGELTVNNSSALDFEQTPTISLVVSVNDGALSASATVTINVNDVDETSAPIIADQTFSVAEGAAVNTVVGTVVASDPNNDVLTFAIVSGNTANAFVLSSAGQLTVNSSSAIDFETQPSFTLLVSVTDATHTSFATVTVNVTDVPENTAPVVVAPVADKEMNEDQSLVVVAESIAAIFDDAENNTLSFDVQSSSPDVLVEISGDQIIATPANDFFGSTTVTVTANDGEFTSEDSFIVNVLSINDAPDFLLSTNVLELQQDFSGLRTVTVNPGFIPANELSQTVTYSLSPTSVSFANVSINPATGTVSITAVPGSIGLQVFTVTADDGGAENAEVSRTFTLDVQLVTSIEGGKSSFVKMYPNPASGSVQFDVPFSSYTIEMFDGNGKMVLTKSVSSHEASEETNISHLKSGFYLVKVQSDSQVVFEKLLVK